MPKYLIRADIKSYYKSISHHQLIKDIQVHYHGPKMNLMLELIIVNPIETPRGHKNPDTGIALRGPLSQFFSALYLKPLDEEFNEMWLTFGIRMISLSCAKACAVSIAVSSVSCRYYRKGVCACPVKKRVSEPLIGASIF
ncbi:hypothetical protein [Legionella sp. km535]|uniref:hypothetical protein n=1 Tax=Legionella sp. km535 TaxID=2498107 RepID=UPI001F40122D|nr:hypothetical protein [Legionella sp. km535]